MKKTLANRRMFRQGGAVNSGPTGILASSPSLIDAVAQDAMNVQGGPTVRMADGGIVRMANGGPVFPLVPTRTPQIASDAFGVRFDPTTARRARNERGLTPADKLVFEELVDTGRRIFPRDLEPGHADIEKVRRGQPVSNLERAAFSALGGLRAIGQDAAQYLQATGGKLMEKEIAGQPGALPDVSIPQREAILDMTKMYPEIKGFIENEAFLAIKANPELSPEELKGTVARALEAPERRGAEDAFLQGISRFGPREDEVMTDMTDADPEYVGDVPLDPGQDDTLGEEDERTDPTGEVRRAKAQGQDDDASFLAGITPPRKPDVEDPNIAGGSQNEIEALGTPADAKDAAEQVRQTFDKPDMKPEETKRGMEYYLDQFKGAVPKYEGMSESEKGMLIAEAGLRVMAGQSPQAIENIAKGLQGVSKEFIADKKAKRAYDQQINLSAAKYALQAVRKDEERVAALAKEKRAQKQFIVKNSFTENGVKYEPGSLYIGTVGQLTTPEFASNVLPNLTTEGVYKEILDSKAKAAKLFRRVGEGKGAPTVKQLDEALAGYNTLADEARTSAKMLTMIDSSIITNAEGKVTGLTSWASRKLDSLKNSIGMKKELTLLDNISSKKGADSKEYQYQQQVIANMMLKEILGEGSKNVSNIDRDLAQQIVGLMSDAGAITANPKLLNQRLQNVRSLVDQGLNRRLRDMKNKEFSWQNILNTAGAPASSRFGQIRQGLVEDIGRVASLDAARQAPVLRVSDYFDFKKGTLKKKIPR